MCALVKYMFIWPNSSLYPISNAKRIANRSNSAPYFSFLSWTQNITIDARTTAAPRAHWDDSHCSLIKILVSWLIEGINNVVNWRNAVARTLFCSFCRGSRVPPVALGPPQYPPCPAWFLLVISSNFWWRGWSALRQKMHLCIKNGSATHLKLRAVSLCFRPSLKMPDGMGWLSGMLEGMEGEIKRISRFWQW